MPTLAYIAGAMSFVPAAVGLARYGRLDKSMRAFTIFAIIGSISVTVEFCLGKLGITNYFLADIYYLLSMLLLAIVYHWSISGKRAQNMLKGAAIVYFLVWAVDEICFANRSQVNSTLAMISSIFLVIISMVALQTLLRTPKERLTAQPVFWISTGTILYSAGSFLVFGLSNELLKLSLAYFTIAWHINWILYIVSMLMFTKGLLCKSQV